MTPDDAILAFKPIAQADVLAIMLLDRDPVYQLTELMRYLHRIDAWLTQARAVLATGPQPQFEAMITRVGEITTIQLPRATRCLANAIKERDKGKLGNPAGVVGTESLDNDPSKSCIDRQQDINSETLNDLSEADTLSERVDAISDWGHDTKENLGQCIDDAFGQFDHDNAPDDSPP